jgi:mannose-1-phosphate guanylyltransferase/mannose-6-phosphate isomerase
MIGPCRAAIDTGAEDLGFLRLGAEAYGQAEAISFDYAIMERVDRVAAVPLTSGWSDLGAWDTLWQAAGPDADGNATSGPATAARLSRQLPALGIRRDPAGGPGP